MECESLLRHASLVGYLTLDKYGKIVRVNECGAVLLGTSRGVLLGQPFQDYVATEDRGAFEVFSNQVFNSDDSCECQMTLLRKQPSLTKFCAQLSAVAVRRKGSVTRCLLTLIDISEFARSG
jgi:PAS domain S-box-containing protein